MKVGRKGLSGVGNALRIILIFEEAFEAIGAAIVVFVFFGPWVAERIDAAALPKSSICADGKWCALRIIAWAHDCALETRDTACLLSG